MDWFRWHNGTADDPKWRAVARRSKASVPEVLAVWIYLCENANQAEVRGTLDGWDSEDVAAALGLATEKVEAIVKAMQGKVLSGPALTGWEKRNPPSDSSTERVRRHRARKAESEDETVTPRYETPQEEERDTEKESLSAGVIKMRKRERDERERVVDQVIIAANQGMRDNPTIGDYTPISTGHASRQAVFDWLAAGVPPEVARKTVYRKAQEYFADDRNEQVTSMNYFTKPVMAAFEKHRAETTEKPNGSPGLPRDRGSVSEAGRSAAARRDKYAARTETGAA